MAAVLLTLAIALSSLTGCVKVVKIGDEGKLTGNTAFNADSDVASIWESKALPELNKKAVDLKTFLTEAKGDLKSLDKKYGKYSMGSSGELSYVVKGTAKVTKIEQQKKAGYMEVALEGYSGKETIRLQIGTVFKGSAVRDSLDFIKYEDFKNQVQWAAVSQSIHTVIMDKVIKPLNVSSLSGKTVEFVGCFTVDDNSQLLITPVQLTVK
jgi:predicted lipoprotein